MEDKLESYRLRKRRTENFQKVKETFFKMFTSSPQKDSSETRVKIEVNSSSLHKW